MRLTQTLLGYLNRVFEKDPKPFWALRIRYDGGLTWRVDDGVLTLTAVGGPGTSQTIDLAGHTLQSLAEFIAGLAGYTVTHIAADRAKLSARVLLDAEGDQATSNGDRLMGYTSLLWAWLEACAVQLAEMREQARLLPLQMSVGTGEGVWLDEIGGYYKVPREVGEIDQLYGPRIIAETLRPRGNNNAIANAIQTYTGQDANVLDVVVYGGDFPLYDSTIDHDASQTHSAGANPIYGLFDVTYAYDLINGGDVTAFQDSIKGIVDRMRDAGTHLRALALTASSITDTLTPPTDAAVMVAAAALADTRAAPTEASTEAVFMGMADALTLPTEDMGTELDATFRQAHDGSRSHDAKVSYNGNYLIEAPLEGGSITTATQLLEDLYLYIGGGDYLTAGGDPIVWPR